MEEIGFGSEVKMKMSNEKGVVIGIATYSEQPTQYFVRFLAADGRQVEGWRNNEALVVI